MEGFWCSALCQKRIHTADQSGRSTLMNRLGYGRYSLKLCTLALAGEQEGVAQCLDFCQVPSRNALEITIDPGSRFDQRIQL